MLDFFTSVFGEQLGPFGPVIVIGVLGVVLILMALPALLNKRQDPLDRLHAQVRGENKAQRGEDDGGKLRIGSKSDKLEKYATFLEPQDEEEYSAVQLKLIQAGYRSKDSVRIYYFSQFALGLGLLSIGLLFAFIKSQTEEVTTQAMIVMVAFPAMIGYMAPKYWVTRRVAVRQEEIMNGFPDSLDLMLVCVEAGQSMDQSILRVATEIRPSYPALAEEFEIVSHETKAGKDKINVLRDMSERAGVADVASFVTVLIQSQAFGTSIADALRVYAEEMRDKRVMRAEEKANKLPTKMTLCTMSFTVPPLLIILIGPSVHDMIVLFSTTKF